MNNESSTNNSGQAMKYYMYGIVLVVALAIVGGIISAISQKGVQNNPVQEATLQTLCEQSDGTWIESAQECEGVSQAFCNNQGGSFDECASSCRNDATAEFCTLQCIQVCSFGNETELSQKVSILISYGVDNTKEYQVEIEEGQTAFDVLTNLENKGDFSFDFKDYGGELGAAITAINGVEADSTKEYWQFFVNGESSMLGISTYEVKSGDVLRFEITSF